MTKPTFHPKLLFLPCEHGLRNRREFDATTEKTGEAHVGEPHEPHVVFCGLTRFPRYAFIPLTYCLGNIAVAQISPVETMEYALVEQSSETGYMNISHIYLILAFLFLIFSFYMLHESVEMMKRSSDDETETLKPESGLILAWLSSVGIFFVWLMINSASLTDLEKFNNQPGIEVVKLFLQYPQEYIPAFLLPGVFPLALATYKFSLCSFWLHARGVDNSNVNSRSFGAALFAAVITSVSLMANISKLIVFFETR